MRFKTPTDLLANLRLAVVSADELFASYESAIDSIDRYVLDGIPLGGNLRAIVSNDLRETIATADDHRRLALFPIVGYLYNDVPSSCWGSREKHDAWMAMEPATRRDLLAYSEFGRRRGLEPTHAEDPSHATE